jgi:hypothetical protein
VKTDHLRRSNTRTQTNPKLDAKTTDKEKARLEMAYGAKVAGLFPRIAPALWKEL